MATARNPQPASPGARGENQRAPVAPRALTNPPPEKVAQRAYEIWQATGRPSGRDQEHWYQAERELQTPPQAARTPPR
jgi:Protein of unknown function (DUF2934)